MPQRTAEDKHPAGVGTALAVNVFFKKKCSYGYSAVHILFQNWRLKFTGNFDIKFKDSLVFTEKHVLKLPSPTPLPATTKHNGVTSTMSCKCFNGTQLRDIDHVCKCNASSYNPPPPPPPSPQQYCNNIQ